MFNKSSVFGRNEPITRRDAPPVLGPGSRPVTTMPNQNAATVKSATGNPSPSTTAPATTALPATAANAPVPVTKEAGKELSANGNVMGAHLIVGPDVKLKGAEILDCDTLVVEGRVEATMDSRVIRIAENGSFSGKVSIDIAEIHGTFEGDLTARSQLIIHSTGRVSGTIRYGKLVADEGCELCGDISVISDKMALKSKPGVDSLVVLSAAVG